MTTSAPAPGLPHRADWRAALRFPLPLEPLAFSLKTYAAAMIALVISYWMEVQEPQWSVITVYLVSQPLLGAIWAKGAFRMLGTLGGAIVGVTCVALFVQAGPMFILAMAGWLGICAYNATLARNYASYGFSLSALTAVLIGFGSIDMPLQAWNVAGDRTTEVTLGIVCAGLIHATVLPRYASTVLVTSLATTFSGLARYAAVILKPGTPDRVFTGLRRQMAGDVIKFDTLRSYAVFEAPELKGYEASLSRMMRAFLGVLSVGRGLFYRIEDVRRREDKTMAGRLDPALDRIAGLLGAVAADPAGARSASAGPRLEEARTVLARSQAELEALVGAEPVETLANGLLILRRIGDMVESLSRVVAGVTGQATGPALPRANAVTPPDRGAALAQALRSAAAILLLGTFWIASAWTAGASAMTGLAIVVVVFVIVENPRKMAINFAAGATLATIVGFLVMAFVVPYLAGFPALAIVLGTILIPSGIFMALPKYTGFATAFAAFFASQVGLGNVPSYDVGTYVDHGTGFVLGLGMGVLGIVMIFPYDPAKARRREWAEVVSSLPAAARGQRPESSARTPIHTALLKLMPRLDVSVTADDDILNATFGMASLSLELIRLRARVDQPGFPAEARQVVIDCLETLAGGFERLLQARREPERIEIVDASVAAVATARSHLGSMAAEPGPVPDLAGIILLAHALASLRFITDRFGFERAFLTVPIR